MYKQPTFDCFRGHLHKIKSLSFYGKRQTSNPSSEFFKMENKQTKQLKTIFMDKKLRETAKLCVQIMNRKRQVNGKLGHLGTNSRLT